MRDATKHLLEEADPAAYMADTCLVITVDTMVARRAGALGRPVWALFPFRAD